MGSPVTKQEIADGNDQPKSGAVAALAKIEGQSANAEVVEISDSPPRGSSQHPAQKAQDPRWVRVEQLQTLCGSV